MLVFYISSLYNGHMHNNYEGEVTILSKLRYPTIENVFEKLKSLGIHIESLDMGLHYEQLIEGAISYPLNWYRQQPITKEYHESSSSGTPLLGGWRAYAQMWISLGCHPRGEAQLPEGWQRATKSHPDSQNVYNFVASGSYGGVEALYRLLNGVTTDLEQFYEQHGQLAG